MKKEQMKMRGIRMPDWMWSCMQDESLASSEQYTPSSIVREELESRYRKKYKKIKQS